MPKSEAKSDRRDEAGVCPAGLECGVHDDGEGRCVACGQTYEERRAARCRPAAEAAIGALGGSVSVGDANWVSGYLLATALGATPAEALGGIAPETLIQRRQAEDRVRRQTDGEVE